MTDFDELFIYVPEASEILHITIGSGDNLSQEDEANGYTDYLYYTSYLLESGLQEYDGGMLLLKELAVDKYKRLEEAVPDILGLHYGNPNLDYIKLKERNFIMQFD